MQVICDSCDEIYFNRIFDPYASRISLNWERVEKFYYKDV